MDRRATAAAHEPVVEALDDTIDLLDLHRVSPRRYPFLLQSAAADASLGRYDILFAAPGESLVLNTLGELDGAAKQGGFLAALDALWRAECLAEGVPDLPFTGGWFLYLGYELAGEVEPSLSLHDDPLLPVAFAVRCRAAVIRNTQTGQCHLVAEQDADFDRAQLHKDVAAATAFAANEAIAEGGAPRISEEPAESFMRAVTVAKEKIAAGDVYQANLSRAWTIEQSQPVAADSLYQSLSEANPAPFAGLARWGDTAIVSSSPERLLKIRDGIASTRPIAGTRPRSDDQQTDDSLSAELFAHPKEIAEHVMLIDLERNDLGRICKAGTVEVDEMMVLESYTHVHHIVSNVRGEMRADVTPGEAIRAVFPGGTITGCPKVRCMEIIHELEDCPRGAYTGSFGYLNLDGSLDLNILIRTIVKNGDILGFRAGSGIVADSEPEAELAETRAKAEGMIRALTS